MSSLEDPAFRGPRTIAQLERALLTAAERNTLHRGDGFSERGKVLKEILECMLESNRELLLALDKRSRPDNAAFEALLAQEQQTLIRLRERYFGELVAPQLAVLIRDKLGVQRSRAAADRHGAEQHGIAYAAGQFGRAAIIDALGRCVGREDYQHPAPLNGITLSKAGYVMRNRGLSHTVTLLTFVTTDPEIPPSVCEITLNKLVTKADRTRMHKEPGYGDQFVWARVIVANIFDLSETYAHLVTNSSGKESPSRAVFGTAQQYWMSPAGLGEILLSQVDSSFPDPHRARGAYTEREWGYDFLAMMRGGARSAFPRLFSLYAEDYGRRDLQLLRESGDLRYLVAVARRDTECDFGLFGSAPSSAHAILTSFNGSSRRSRRGFK